MSVPTGSGKNLASMRFALAHAKKYHKNRIIVVIPYTAIIDQNAKEIRDVFQSNEAVLEHHSNVLPKEDMSKDERDWHKLLTERWDMPVIFTTQVHFLDTLFDGSCQSTRRLQALADSIIIFDEIQTLPVKCTYIFNLAMNFLKNLPVLRRFSARRRSLSCIGRTFPFILMVKLCLRRIRYSKPFRG